MFRSLITALVAVVYLAPAFMVSPWTLTRDDNKRIHVGWLDTIRQTTPASCGPALLAAMQRLLGSLPYTEYHFLRRLPVGEQGISLLEFAREAQAIGWPGKWYEGAFTDLTSVAKPIPVYLNSPVNHFVLVLYASPELTLVLDPALGHVAMSTKQFLTTWSRLFYSG